MPSLPKPPASKPHYGLMHKALASATKPPPAEQHPCLGGGRSKGANVEMSALTHFSAYLFCQPFSFLFLENAPEKIQQHSRLKDYERDQLWVLHIHPYLVAHPTLNTTLQSLSISFSSSHISTFGTKPSRKRPNHPLRSSIPAWAGVGLRGPTSKCPL